MPLPERQSLIVYTAALLAVFVLAALTIFGWSEEGVRVVVRLTAKTALLLFCTAFSASALRALFPSPAFTSLRRNRRYIGLSFSLALGVHLSALIVLGLQFPNPFLDDLDAFALAGGALAYAFTFAMAATSNDAAVAWVGPRRWHRLHLIGGWYIWIVFAQSYLPRAILDDPTYIYFAIVTLAVPGLRIAHWRRARAAARS